MPPKKVSKAQHISDTRERLFRQAKAAVKEMQTAVGRMICTHTYQNKGLALQQLIRDDAKRCDRMKATDIKEELLRCPLWAAYMVVLVPYLIDQLRRQVENYRAHQSLWAREIEKLQVESDRNRAEVERQNRIITQGQHDCRVMESTIRQQREKLSDSKITTDSMQKQLRSLISSRDTAMRIIKGDMEHRRDFAFRMFWPGTAYAEVTV